MLRAGKHRHKSYEQVAATDRGYCEWALREGKHYGTFRDFAAWLRRTHGGVVEFGKYRGRFYDELLDTQEEYCRWAMALRDPSDRMRGFLDFAEGRAKRRPRKPPAKKSKPAPPPPPPPPPRPEENGGILCKICFAEPVKAVFYPCGHASCEGCSALLNSVCPFCRADIVVVVKAFL